MQSISFSGIMKHPDAAREMQKGMLKDKHNEHTATFLEHINEILEYWYPSGVGYEDIDNPNDFEGDVWDALDDNQKDAKQKKLTSWRDSMLGILSEGRKIDFSQDLFEISDPTRRHPDTEIINQDDVDQGAKPIYKEDRLILYNFVNYFLFEMFANMIVAKANSVHYKDLFSAITSAHSADNAMVFGDSFFQSFASPQRSASFIKQELISKAVLLDPDGDGFATFNTSITESDFNTLFNLDSMGLGLSTLAQGEEKLRDFSPELLSSLQKTKEEILSFMQSSALFFVNTFTWFESKTTDDIDKVAQDMLFIPEEEAEEAARAIVSQASFANVYQAMERSQKQAYEEKKAQEREAEELQAKEDAKARAKRQAEFQAYLARIRAQQDSNKAQQKKNAQKNN